MTTTVSTTALTGAYLVGEKISELLLEQWKVWITSSQYKLPKLCVQGLDYGFDQDALACQVSFNRAAGKQVPQSVDSVVPFDANGLGSWAASESLRLAAQSPDGRLDGVLFVLNSAPGRNVKHGGKNNVRENFIGAKLKNGAIVVGTNSDQLWEYLADQIETAVDLPLWLSKSQARGVDVFQTIAFAFYQEASQPGWKGGNHEIQHFKSRPLQDKVKIVMHQEPVFNKDGVPHYLLSSKAVSKDLKNAGWQHLPVPATDIRSAAYSAFRLANGGQPQREKLDSGNVASLSVLLDGFDVQSDEPLEIWAQLQNDGSLFVGPAVDEAWQFRPADRPVIALDRKVAVRDLLTFADEVFRDRLSLAFRGRQIADAQIALPEGAVPGRVDYFGNHDNHNARPQLGQIIRFDLPDGFADFPVRSSMFDADAASTDEQARNATTHGFSMQASGGGWYVNVINKDGVVRKEALQTSQAYVRTDNPEIPSAAYAFGLERNGLDQFEPPKTLGVSVVAAQDFAPSSIGGLV